MKKLLIMFMALVCTATLMAQRIAVVDANGSTSVYKTLEAAIKGAADNSVIYLPGGTFPIADSVKITKKLTIIGIGHKANNDNVDGITTISGNLFFNEGSSSSAVMGCYITGTVYIGNGDVTINDVLIRFCNLGSIEIKNNHCYDIVINQNYIRGEINCSFSAAEISNNICLRLSRIDGGLVSNNIITYVYNKDKGLYVYPICDVKNTEFRNNIIMNTQASSLYGYTTLRNVSDNIYYRNMAFESFSNDEYVIDLSGIDKSVVFENPNGVSSSSDYHFKDEYKQYESQVGIYAGEGFNDDQLAPVPYIVSKQVDEQTDASGRLNVKFRVKAGE